LNSRVNNIYFYPIQVQLFSSESIFFLFLFWSYCFV